MIPVWDLFVRIFHWGLAAIVLTNRFFNEGGDEWHERLGYLACAAIGLRVVWGFVSPSPYARFRTMVAEFQDLSAHPMAYLSLYLRGGHRRTLTHPPTAVLGMGFMVLLVLALGMTGWMMSWDRYFGEEWLEEVHILISNVLIAMVIVHVLAVLRESFVHRENLILSMITGKKRRN